MNLRGIIGFSLIAIGSVSFVYADEILNAIKGSCSITASAEGDQFVIRLERNACSETRSCSEQTFTQPVGAWSGLSLADLRREGTHAVGALRAEAGSISCSGNVHNQALVGDYTFEPNQAFVSRMDGLGIHGLTTEKLQAYTLFHIEAAWVQSLQKEGIDGIDANSLIALKIFKVEPNYVDRMRVLGFGTPTAQKLIAMKVHHVDPDEVMKIRALGYQPTLDQTLQMGIFRVTPDFIERMQSRGIKNLTISKLVQIRNFKLDE
jgi:hypothetical protein